MKNYRLLLPALALTLTSVAVIGASTVSAHTQAGPQDTIIERLAERFGVEATEVQSAFDELHQERQTEMQTQLETRLQTAVEAGQLTAEQKQLILDKHAEMQSERPEKPEDWFELSPEERQAAMGSRREAMETRHAELETWADQNGIDLSYLQLNQGEGMRQGRGHRGF